ARGEVWGVAEYGIIGWVFLEQAIQHVCGFRALTAVAIDLGQLQLIRDSETLIGRAGYKSAKCPELPVTVFFPFEQIKGPSQKCRGAGEVDFLAKQSRCCELMP